MNRRGFFGVVGGLLSLIGLKPKFDWSPYVDDGPPVFDLNMLPLPVVHKDFSYRVVCDDPGPELDQEKSKAWWDRVCHHHRVRGQLMRHHINPNKLTDDQLDLWGRVFK